METEKDDYYNVARRKQIRKGSRKFRKKYPRYKEVEIVYNIQHKKLLEPADDAGVLYRIDGCVFINRDIFSGYLEQFRQPSKTKGRAAPKISRRKKWAGRSGCIRTGWMTGISSSPGNPS